MEYIMSAELRELISGAMTDLDPQADNQEVVADSETLDDSEYETEEPVDMESEDASEDDEDVTESEDEDSSEDEDETTGSEDLHEVKVNGEVLEVSLKELKSGYQRQADYTREKQALKREMEEFESMRGEFSEAFEGIQALEDAWEDNPITVLAQFAVNTEDPTQAVALLIKELAGANLLDRDFLEMFGVTSDVQQQWAQEVRSSRQDQEQRATGNRREQELVQAQEELEIQRAIAEYDRQIDEILDENGLDFTVKQRNAFRQELAKYAADNELTNLKAAFKAFKYEEAQKKKSEVAKSSKKTSDKKAASVVARSGSSADGAQAVTDSSDLSAVVAAAMKDVQASLS
jgi:hypothetical protein